MKLGSKKKYGPEIGPEIEASRRKMELLSDDDREAMMDELRSIEEDMAEGCARVFRRNRTLLTL